MSSRRVSSIHIHNVKVTVAKATVLYDTDGKAIAVNVTANVWVAGMHARRRSSRSLRQTLT